MKIKIKYHNQNCKLVSFGNWIDLKSAETVSFKKGTYKLISLGVSMELPKYYQANVVSRSGTFKKYGLIMTNHYGVIDDPDDNGSGYSGNEDIWKFGAYALKESNINEGDRICQFEIRPTMKAPWYVKLKWLFNSNITFVEVENLEAKNRGGFGKSGI